MKTLIVAAVLGCVMALAGCATGPVAFKTSSVPVPSQGYKVIGTDVTGTSDQVWFLGFGGSLSAQQHKAYKSALGQAVGADGLVGMSIERHTFAVFPIVMLSTIRVTGTPIKFNDAPKAE